jgi:hypothetical protein
MKFHISNFYQTVPKYSYVICDLLRYYAAQSDNSVPAFRDNLSVPSSTVKNSKYWNSLFLKMGPKCPETSVQNYHSALHNTS